MHEHDLKVDTRKMAQGCPGSPDGTTPALPASTTAHLNQLLERINETHKLIGILKERIAPLLRRTPEPDYPEHGPSIDACGYVQALFELAYQVEVINSRLNNLHRAVEQ